MAEQLAYDITRLLFEKQAELAAIHPEARNLSLDRPSTGSPAPFHPGAIRYYTGERGRVRRDDRRQRCLIDDRAARIMQEFAGRSLSG